MNNADTQTKEETNMRFYSTSLSVLALAAGLALVAGPASSQTLRIGISEDTDTLDPAQGRTFGGRQVFASLCDKLFDIDENTNVVGRLVTSWTVSPDGMNITLNLRKDVVFHDGTSFDAEAVKFNLERSFTIAESARKGDIRAIARVEVVDPLTARLVLSEPFAPLLSQLADRAGMMISPKAAAAVDAKSFSNAPVCSGPYKLTERVVQSRIVLDRFANYWNKSALSFERLIYVPMPDPTVRLNNLLAGQLDIIERVATNDLDKLKSNSNFVVAGGTGLGHFHIQFNLQSDSPFGKNAKLRQAVDAAMDRSLINNVVFGGAFVPSNQPVSLESPFYAKRHPVVGRNIERAKALVRESGVASPSLPLIVNNDPSFIRVAQVVQSLLGEVGIQSTLQPLEASTGLGVMTSGQFVAAVSTWSGRADPDANAYTYLGCKGSQNFGKYCRPEVEEFLSGAARVSDPAKRAELYGKAADLWLVDLPVIYLYHNKNFFGLRAGIQGFKAIPDGIMRLEGVTMKN
jgi:peptide/nickel transport system substrate-binding protein